MSAWQSFLRWLVPTKAPSFDRYHIVAITNAAELNDPKHLPLEIRYVLGRHERRREHLEDLLNRGFGIAVRTVDHTPEKILQSVERISHLTQENTIVPWLPRLLEHGDVPIFTEFELRTAEREGIELYQEVKTILEWRFEFKKLVLIDLHNHGLSEREREWMLELNRDLYPVAINYIIHRVQFDIADTRTESAQTIIKALILVGPIAHLLEHWVSGIGKLFAASADDILSEVAELSALRGAGFPWRQLMKRCRWLVPVLALATYGAFSVEGLIESGQTPLAGIVFGFSAVALSLTTACQSLFLFRRCYAQLRRMGKLPPNIRRSDWTLAWRQDFSNPARGGLMLGAFCAPVAAALVFTLWPEGARNGWILALLGSVESMVAGMAVVLAAKINRSQFRKKLRTEIARMAQ